MNRKTIVTALLVCIAGEAAVAFCSSLTSMNRLEQVKLLNDSVWS